MTMMVLRPESSVAVGTNEDGEMTFVCDSHGGVVHRTPEELGLPRTIPDVAPGKLMPWIDQSAVIKVRRVREFAESAAEIQRREKLKHLDAEVESVRATELAAEEPELETTNEETERKEEMENQENVGRQTAPAEQKITEAQIAEIKAAPKEGASELARRLGIAPHLVYYYRAKFKKEGGVRRVTVDAKRPGAAAALDRSLAKVDKAREQAAAAQTPVVHANSVPMVKLELTLDEAARPDGKVL